MKLFHLDSDFLIHAVSHPGVEQDYLFELSRSAAELQVSAVVWYEFNRGPRTPGQLAIAHSFLQEDGIIPFTHELAIKAGDLFRSLGSSRRQAADITIAATAIEHGATLVTRNASDFQAIPGLSLEIVAP